MFGKIRIFSLIPVLVVLTAPFLSQPVLAQRIGEPYQLSDEMVLFGDVYLSEISPDGEYVVYMADQDEDDIIELYSVPIEGGTPIKLSGPIASGSGLDRGVTYFEISADSSRVVYLADQEVRGKNELYTVPIAGGIAGKLNSPLTANGDVLGGFVSPFNFDISADSTYVVYLEKPSSLDTVNLYSVPINGGSPVRLNPELGNNNEVFLFKISPDGQHTVFFADVIDQRNELFSVPTSGELAAIRINPPLGFGRDVFVPFDISPDSSRVVYRSNLVTNNVTDIFSTPIAGGSPVKLNPNLVSGGRVRDFILPPNTDLVVYIADQDTNNVDELYSVRIAGGSASKLNPSLGVSRQVRDYVISPDGSRVVYTADQNFDEVYELYSVPLAGGVTSIKLNPTPVLNGDIKDTQGSVKVTNDGAYVVYVADLDADSVDELYSVPIVGGTNIKLNAPMVDGGDIQFQTERSVVLTSDSQDVFYLADQDTNDSFELYRVPISGGPKEKVNASLPFGGTVSSFRLSENQQQLVLIADQDIFDERELFAVQLIQDNDELCLPIKAGNSGGFAVICL